MKKLNVKGKLSLNKETIAKLSNEQMQNINGASGDPNTSGCTSTCTCGCPTAGTGTGGGHCCIPPCW